MHIRLPSTILTVIVSALAFTACTAWARSAAADCGTDIDCIGATCGSAVCQQSVGGANCVAAGTDPQGFDGTCGSDADCKCAGEGATCVAGLGHCSFTLPQDAGTTATDAGGGSSDSTDNTPACATAYVGHTGRFEIGAVLLLGCCVAGLGLARGKR